jgi:hypothetical protein
VTKAKNDIPVSAVPDLQAPHKIPERHANQPRLITNFEYKNNQVLQYNTIQYKVTLSINNK